MSGTTNRELTAQSVGVGSDMLDRSSKRDSRRKLEPQQSFPVRKAQPPPAPLSLCLYLACEARLPHSEL